MAWFLHEHRDAAALQATMADALLRACEKAADASRIPVLSLAGGSTPLPTYRQLAAALGKTPLRLMPGDDRCVPHDDPACNLRALRQIFARNGLAQYLPLTAEDGEVTASLRIARQQLAHLEQDFDAVVLGMGGDGHFASLFPHSAGLEQGLSLHAREDAIALTPALLPPEAPYPRITLTLPRLLRSRTLLLAITGEAKRDVLQAAAQPDADAQRWPVAALLRAAPHLQVHWSS